MLNNEEAGTGYNELLQKLREFGAEEIVAQIEQVVGAGRIQQRKPDFIQERLPATSRLAVALRMLACWIEPILLVSETRTLLHDVSHTEVSDIYWAMDRRDTIEPDTGPLFASQQQFPDTAELIRGLPQVSTHELDQIRRQLDQLYQILTELESTESS